MPKRRNWSQAAGRIWPVLTAAARSAERRRLTYGEIAPLIPTNPLNVGRALGPVQDYCLEARLPPLTAIVVGRSSGVPGSGFIAWDIDNLDDAFDAVFEYDWSRLENPFTAFIEGETEDGLADRLLRAPNESGDVYARVRDRGIAQRVFRRALLKAYDYSCCVCGVSFEEVLQAAHIVSWVECTLSERMDVRNGLLLCANHHALFDSGLISVTPYYTLEYYDPHREEGPYSPADQVLTASLHGRKIVLPKQRDLAPSIDRLRRRREMIGWV